MASEVQAPSWRPVSLRYFNFSFELTIRDGTPLRRVVYKTKSGASTSFMKFRITCKTQGRCKDYKLLSRNAIDSSCDFLPLYVRCINIINNYWMRLSTIAIIIKAKVCVICRSRRLRGISQTEALIIIATMRKPNPNIVLLCILIFLSCTCKDNSC